MYYAVIATASTNISVATPRPSDLACIVVSRPTDFVFTVLTPAIYTLNVNLRIRR